jgi:hypothetical protein
MKSFVNSLFVITVAIATCLYANVSFADQEAKVDGFWLKQGLDACSKVYSNGQVRDSSTAEDAMRCLPVISWVMGYIAAQWENNFLFDMQRKATQNAKDAHKKKEIKLYEFAEMGGRFHVPLYGLPNPISTEQVQLVLFKYLNDHPEKLHDDPQTIIKNALTEAFLAHAK